MKQYKDREWLAAQKAKGLSGRAIALQNGYSVASIRRWMIKFGLWEYGVFNGGIRDIDRARAHVKRSQTNKGPSWSARKIAAIIARRKVQSPA